MDRTASDAKQVLSALYSDISTRNLCVASSFSQNKETNDTSLCVFVARERLSFDDGKEKGDVLGAIAFEKSDQSCMLEITDLFITHSCSEERSRNVALALVGAVESVSKEHGATHGAEFTVVSTSLCRENLLFWLELCRFSVISSSALPVEEEERQEARPYMLCAQKQTKQLTRALQRAAARNEQDILLLCGALAISAYVSASRKRAPSLTLCKGRPL